MELSISRSGASYRKETSIRRQLDKCHKQLHTINESSRFHNLHLDLRDPGSSAKYYVTVNSVFQPNIWVKNLTLLGFTEP